MLLDDAPTLITGLCMPPFANYSQQNIVSTLQVGITDAPVPILAKWRRNMSHTHTFLKVLYMCFQLGSDMTVYVCGSSLGESVCTQMHRHEHQTKCVTDTHSPPPYCSRSLFCFVFSATISLPVLLNLMGDIFFFICQHG